MLCHIAIESEWDAACQSGWYDRSTLKLDLASVGFIHASDSYEQAARVVRYLFGDFGAPVALLDLDGSRLEAVGLRVAHEPVDASDPHSERFPHIYGGPLPTSVPVRVHRFANPGALLVHLDAGEAALMEHTATGVIRAISDDAALADAGANAPLPASQ